MTGPLPYIGGKNRLAKKIISILPDHTTYVEPFAGGAQVFFHKEPSRVEILNDLNGEIVNFFRVCQWHYTELIRHLRYCLASRKLFKILSAADPDTLTDVQRAARFFYLQKNSFGGHVVHQNYHYCVTKPPNYNPKRIPEIIEKAHARLQGVQLESLPYEVILEKYDSPGTLFYLDPPYWGRKLYRFNFSENDFLGLKRRLDRIRGKFILSLNDLPEVRTLFSGFAIERLEIAYTSQQIAGRRYGELLIMNFSPSSLTSKSISKASRRGITPLSIESVG
jgi:DNA adenine methylase